MAIPLTMSSHLVEDGVLERRVVSACTWRWLAPGWWGFATDRPRAPARARATNKARPVLYMIDVRGRRDRGASRSISGTTVSTESWCLLGSGTLRLSEALQTELDRSRHRPSSASVTHFSCFSGVRGSLWHRRRPTWPHQRHATVYGVASCTPSAPVKS